ncbi:MAG: bifunctional proline dehydrogenase/L-glutamate gamma-semialdehyde dehydrogenase PutA [Alphaproteobacteria bacterium]
MIFGADELSHPGGGAPLRGAVAALYRADESACVRALLRRARLDDTANRNIARLARRFVTAVRKGRHAGGGVDAFLNEYGLSNREGVILMCLAEALLRIPDAATANRLIRDKISAADWDRHFGHSDSLLVNASTFGLMLTGRVVRLDSPGERDIFGMVGRLIAKSGEPVIRQAVTTAMAILGHQFIMGRTIEDAISRAAKDEAEGYRTTYDMLGEAALTAEDAERYFKAYGAAIDALGATEAAARAPDLFATPSISVKLSALHPRFEYAQMARAVPETADRVRALACQARDAGIGFTIDSEEADRLDITLDVFARILADDGLRNWDGLGLAVQTYLKRATAVIDWLAYKAQDRRRRLQVRLVKGAYWDAEIKHAQERGFDGYPVFTRKASTDVSYISAAKKLLAAPRHFYPQFATHNAHTMATVLELAGTSRDFEFQRLHGMGESLYHQVVGPDTANLPCRIYAPVGSHVDLLPYLVRRLLENGSNSSFVNRITDDRAPIRDIIADPVAQVAALTAKPHPRIPLPAEMFGTDRRNSAGIDLTDPVAVAALAHDVELALGQTWRARPIIGGKETGGARRGRGVRDPADRRRNVGTMAPARVGDVKAALARASAAQPGWDKTPAGARADILDAAADELETAHGALVALLVREAGKTVDDAISEVREAVDYCRYYALRARVDFAAPLVLPGPTGEDNRLELHGRGTFACISPWNFPLAIFIGQVTAALAAGNTVIAKPSDQTPLVAALAVKLLHKAGVPGNVLHLLPGPGRVIGARLAGDQRIKGIAFTGSTETAQAINRTLAARDGPIVPLIAETGGQNAMIVDSSALPEQVVKDVIASAFHSAGQRCSSLRVLFVQTDIAAKLARMLTGAMAELVVGDPMELSTDVGPIIDDDARRRLERHAKRMDRLGRLLYRVPPGEGTDHGTFFAPRLYQIPRLDILQGEVFGPILHLIRYRAGSLDRVIDAVRDTGFGLTLGIHSRIDGFKDTIQSRLGVGNTYVNRNMVGAVVGVQPFGGEGLSGTGPKAGGPNYLKRFATERTVTVNTTAAGGNASLLTLEDEP